MSRRASSIFRGSELPRLLFLVAIAVAGWPVCLMFARSGDDQKPPPVVVPAAKLSPVVPETGVEFQAIEDMTSIQVRESAAYAKLLQKARETSPADLARQARKDLFFTHLWERPARYRGVPIHLTGTAKKIYSYEVAPSMTPGERLYDVWFYSDENRSFPYVLVIQDPPDGLTIGHELNLRISVDAYFFKLLRYRAGDNFRGAPMLIGRMSWIPAAAPAPSTLAELSKIPRINLAIGVLVLFVGYLGLRVFLQVRRNRRVSRPPSRLTSPAVDPLPPEQLAEWLRNIPEEASDDEGTRGSSSRD